MEKSNIKHGNIVELRNGDRLVVNSCSFEIELVRFDKDELEFYYRHDLGGEYNDDLKHETNKELDIIKIYENMSALYDDSINPKFEIDLIQDLIERLKQGDLVWVSDDDEKENWILASYVKLNPNSDIYKYAAALVELNQNHDNYCSYKYIKEVKSKDLNDRLLDYR